MATTKTDPLKRLTIGELDTISRKIGADVMSSIAEASPLRWTALAHVAWFTEKRTDRDAKLERFLDMTSDDLGDYLWPEGEPAEDERTDDEAVTADPTVPAPAP